MTQRAGVASVREQLATLDAEIVSIERRLADIRDLCRVAEGKAMAAIQRGDDQTAKAGLEEQRMRAEAVAPLEADLTVLRAMTGEYRRALEEIVQLSRRPSAS